MNVLRHFRRAPAILAATMLLVTSVPAVAQDIDTPALFLRPHCENPDATQCPFFDVRDPTTLGTPPLKAGDELDMDVVLFNPKAEKIRGFRVWLSYDPAVLEGSSVELSQKFPVVVPGQSDFAPQTGQVKTAANASDGQEPTDPFLPLIRVKFKVSVNAQPSQSPIGFHDLQPNVDGHVVVTSVAAPTVNMIAGPLGTLLVDVRSSTGTPGPAPVSSSSVPAVVHSSSSAATTSSSSVSSLASSSSRSSQASTSSAATTSSSVSSSSSTSAPAAAFELLQVQDVGIGTTGDSLQITWAPLSHPKLQGYNVYYGTLPGRYLQRKSVSVAAVGTIIRDLPRGQTYYAAVRGVDDQNKETAFSEEVSVEIGNPSTASALLGDVSHIVDDGPGNEPEKTDHENPLHTDTPPKHVPGDSGSPSAIILLALSSAVMGTLFALRRQLTASRLPR